LKPSNQPSVLYIAAFGKKFGWLQDRA
jgi:hypothetical protein